MAVLTRPQQDQPHQRQYDNKNNTKQLLTVYFIGVLAVLSLPMTVIMLHNHESDYIMMLIQTNNNSTKYQASPTSVQHSSIMESTMSSSTTSKDQSMDNNTENIASDELDDVTAFSNDTEKYFHAEHSLYNMHDDTTTTSTRIREVVPKAIIHIGPHKTGTTSIQRLIRYTLPDLANDNYEVPEGDWMTRNYLDLNMRFVAQCFKYEESTRTKQCDRMAYNNIQLHATNNKSIIISTENLAYSDTNISLVKETLQPLWGADNIVIIAYYRRYYDWLVSYWNQFNRFYKKRKQFTEYIKDIEHMDTLYYNGSYVYGNIPQWEHYFGINNVKLYNLYDLPNKMTTSESFFCDALPNAAQACEKVKYGELSGSLRYANESPSLIYEDLVYAAVRILLNITTANRLPPPKIAKTIARKARNFQENVLGLTEYDFDDVAIHCPDTATYDWLLQRTIESERRFFPKYFAEQGEKEIYEKFEHDKKTKLCSVNATTVVQHSKLWQQFFKRTFMLYGKYQRNSIEDGSSNDDTDSYDDDDGGGEDHYDGSNKEVEDYKDEEEEAEEYK